MTWTRTISPSDSATTLHADLTDTDTDGHPIAAVDGLTAALANKETAGAAAAAQAAAVQRANHTGSQAISTVTGLQTALDGKSAIGVGMAVMSRSGRYVTIPHSTRSTLTTTLNRLYLVPMRLHRTRTFDRISVEVSAGTASAVVRLGIFADDASFNFPGSLLLDAGTVDGSAAAVVEATINQQLTPGLWWLAAVSQTATTTLRSSATFIDQPSAAAAGGTLNTGLAKASVSGALPASVTPDVETGVLPLIWLRAA